MRVALVTLVAFAGVVACSETQDAEPVIGDAQRIVSLAPNLTELMYSIGAGDQLVGVSAWSDYPPAALDLPVIGDAFSVDQEQLALADPDMLLVWESGTPAHTIDQLRAIGYNVESIRTRGLDDIAAAMLRLGRLTGHTAGATRAAADFRDALKLLRDRHAGLAPIRVFYQVSSRPLFTVNREHYVSKLISICGGENIFDDLGDLAPTVDVEAVVVRDPEVMLASTDAGEDAFGQWQRWPDIAANRYRNQFLLPADEIGRATARVIIAGDAMCAALQRARENRARGALLRPGSVP